MYSHQYLITLTSFVFILLVSVSCNGDLPQEVTIVLDREIKSEAIQVDEETIPQNNCNGVEVTENSVSRSHAVEHRIEASTEVGVNADGSLKVFGTGVNLGVSVASHLGYQYGKIETIEKTITVKASPGYHMIHSVSHQEIWKVGKAVVTINGQSKEIPFRFRTDFALVLLDSSKVNDCIPTPIPTFTSLPSPTPPEPTATIPTPSPVCNGWAALPPVPNSPQSGCVLVVEWWVPPAPTPCGIIITTEAPSMKEGAIGTWWYIAPNGVESHLKAYLDKYSYCEITDLRVPVGSVNHACQALIGIIPSDPEEVRTKFGIPVDKAIRVFYELCQEVPNGFIIEESPSLFTLEVPSGGCIDSYSGAKFSDATIPEQTGGGRRAYRGTVTTTSLTYRITGCELKP